MNRTNYIVKRIMQIIPVLFIVTIMVFVLIRMIPGDPARLMLGEKATQAAVDALRLKLGLDEPLLTQYWIFIKGLLTLDLGDSLVYGVPVADLLVNRFPVTLTLTLFSSLLALLFSIPVGYFAGTHKDRIGDQVVRTSALVAISMPTFWIGLLLMIVFSVHWKIFPAGGWDDTFLGQLRCLILPAFTQSLMTSALLIRNVRNSVVDITSLDYVDFARSKGISERKVRNSHIMRNSLISTLTLLSMRMAALLGGSVIIESVFALPGIGKLVVDSIFARDYAVVQSTVFLFALLVMVINLITDILYSFLDPRVKL